MTLTAAPAPTGAISRRRRMLPPALVIGGLGAATMALRLRDPHDQGSWGLCPSAAVGIYCPGCGGLRAVNDLTHLRFADAASSNLLLVVALPFVVALIAWWTYVRFTGRRWHLAPRTTTALVTSLVTLMIAFAVVRNLPFGAWLAP